MLLHLCALRSACRSTQAAAAGAPIFPLLTEVADTDELKTMTKQLDVAEAMAPTHPHKTAPESRIGTS